MVTLKRPKFLFLATAVCVFLVIFIGVNFLLKAMLPTKDVSNWASNTVRLLSVENFEPGQIEIFILDNVPVVVWRRDYAQQIKALEQLGVVIGTNPNMLDEIKANGEIEIQRGRVLRLEWFVVSAINTHAYACIVLQNAGDFDGFFDPCRGDHFDLWGKVKKGGPSQANLKALPWIISEDGTTVYVDIAGAPVVKQR
jgi:ubiquinol-cytochrome c reductase iron-sulfur subunit